MGYVSLDSQFAQTLLKSLDAIDEVDSLDFKGDPELHALLCELVGRLATQLGPGKWRSRPIGVEDLLAEKYVEWDAPVDVDDKRSSDELLRSTLRGFDRSWVAFQGDTPSGAAKSFLWALDDSRAVTRYELRLNTMSDLAIDALTLADLAHSLCLMDA